MASASATCQMVSAGGAAAVAMYSVLTVARVRPTAASAMHPPEADAEHRAGQAEHRRFAEKQPAPAPGVTPSARSMPISSRRAITEMVTVL